MSRSATAPAMASAVSRVKTSTRAIGPTSPAPFLRARRLQRRRRLRPPQGASSKPSIGQFGIPGSRVYYLAVPPSLVDMCVGRLKEAGMVNDPERANRFHARHRRKAHRPRSRQRPRGHRHRRPKPSPRTRPIASIIISARRRCRICWCCVSPTAFSSRCGTEIHRPCADHRRRGRRAGPVRSEDGRNDRHARRLLRGRRRTARHGAKPHAPGAVHRGDGAAVVAGSPTWCATPRSACSTACGT